MDQELKLDIDNVSKCGKQVKEEVSLAKAQADAKDQASQKGEREASSRSRQFLTRFISESKANVEERKQWQMQQDLRHSRKCLVTRCTCDTNDPQESRNVCYWNDYPPMTISAHIRKHARCDILAQRIGFRRPQSSSGGKKAQPSLLFGALGKVS